jgi:hypothetical protein
MSNEPDPPTSSAGDPDRSPEGENTVGSSNSAAIGPVASELPRLLVERELLSVRLDARTAQLRAVLKDLHDANVELGKLSGRHNPSAAAIDWDTILGSGPD